MRVPKKIPITFFGKREEPDSQNEELLIQERSFSVKEKNKLCFSFAALFVCLFKQRVKEPLLWLFGNKKFKTRVSPSIFCLSKIS